MQVTIVRVLTSSKRQIIRYERTLFRTLRWLCQINCSCSSQFRRRECIPHLDRRYVAPRHVLSRPVLLQQTSVGNQAGASTMLPRLMACLH